MSTEHTDLRRSLEEFATAHGQGAPRPGGWYSPEADSVYYYGEPVAHHGVRLDELLTLYRAIDDNRIVGIKVKSIRRSPIRGALKILISESQQVDLVGLVTAGFMALYALRPERGPELERLRESYQDVIRLVREQKADASQLVLADTA